MAFIDDIASITITRDTRTPSQAGFGTALVAAYHALYADRVRVYGALSEMVTDGFTPYDPAYKAAAAVFAQDPAPPSIKLGRRALAMTQVIDLTPVAAPAIGDVTTVKVDGLTATFTATATTIANVCTGLAAAINALGDVDAIVATCASSASEQTLTGATLDGVSGGASLGQPRFITFTFSSSADWDATSITLSGLDGNGAAQSESIAIPNGGNATVTSTKRYLQVSSIVVPAQSGTGGTATVGTRAPVTAVGSSATKVVCTSAAGELHSYERVTAGNLSLLDATANPGVATDLAAILAADSDWYGLLLDSNGAAEVSAAAAWVESAKKVFGYVTSDTAHLASGSTTCLAYTLKAAGYTRTDGIYHPELGTATAWAAAAWKARQFVGAPGSATAAFKSLAGVSSYDLTRAQRAALESYNLNFYTTAGALALTFPGKIASGEWIDVVRDLDWMRSRLQEGVFGVLVANEKVPFTDEGIGLVAASVRAVLTAAVAAGVLASFSLTVPRASAVSTANKTARNLPGVTFTGVLAGAIHTTAVTGRVSA
jgi:hypothetical protein